MSESTETLGLDRELKAKHRAMWGLGNYPAVATQVIAELGPVLVGECGVQKGDRVLDVAAGSGNAAIPAAALGAQVIATDLAPELFVAGKEAASSPESNWTGRRPMPRLFLSATTSSTWCFRASV